MCASDDLLLEEIPSLVSEEAFHYTHTISPEETSAIQVTLDALNSRRKKLEFKISQLRQLISTYESASEHNLRSILKHQNLISTIRRVPSDVLVEIFRWRVLDERLSDDSCLAPLTLSHVCQQWRDVLLATPSLWTDVQVEPNYASASGIYPTETILELWLARSKGQALDIRIKLTEHEPYNPISDDENKDRRSLKGRPSRPSRLCQMLVLESHRWRTFSLDAAGNYLPDCLCSSYQFPLLLHANFRSGEVRVRSHFFELLKQAPALETFSLSNVIFDPRSIGDRSFIDDIMRTGNPSAFSQWPHLRVLNLADQSIQRQTAMKIVRSLPSLEKIGILVYSFMESNRIPMGERLVLEKLISFKLSGDCLLLDELFTPSLKRLSLGDVKLLTNGGSAVKVLSQFLKRTRTPDLDIGGSIPLKCLTDSLQAVERLEMRLTLPERQRTHSSEMDTDANGVDLMTQGRLSHFEHLVAWASSRSVISPSLRSLYLRIHVPVEQSATYLADLICLLGNCIHPRHGVQISSPTLPSPFPSLSLIKLHITWNHRIRLQTSHQVALEAALTELLSHIGLVVETHKEGWGNRTRPWDGLTIQNSDARQEDMERSRTHFESR